jgi:hypothetical protein
MRLASTTAQVLANDKTNCVNSSKRLVFGLVASMVQA